MAISNHPQLVQAIQDWMMDRSDLATFAPDCVTLTEAYLNFGGNWDEHDRPLRCRQMTTIATITPDANGVYALPADFLQLRRITETSSSPTRRNMSYIEPVGADVWYPDRPGGPGDNYTILGSSIYGLPNSQNPLELVYYAKIPALTDVAPVNWLLTVNPNIYLYGSLMMAADKIKFGEEAQKYALMLRSFVSGMNESDAIGRMARVGLSMRGPCP
jgi:hypothetical protein